MGLYERIVRHLDTDERLITRDMYKKWPYLYDKVIGCVYLVEIEYSDDRKSIEFVWESSLKHIVNRPDIHDVSLLRELILVSVRDSNPLYVSGDLLSYEEYSKYPDRYFVLDICVRVVDRDFPYKTINISPEVYQRNNDVYDLVGVYYLVRNASEYD